jgi:hypothetical protein
LPSAIVPPEISAVTPAAIENTPLAWLPLMVSESAPGPVIARRSLTVSSTPPSTIDWPASDWAKVI